MQALEVHIAHHRPRALAALTRQFRDLDLAEDAFGEACLRALRRWPETGVPDDPFAWLLTVARNAVTVLKVAHLIVLGHSQCGGVKGCLDMCKGHAPQVEAKESFVGRWMDILKPKYEHVAAISDEDEQVRQLEKHAVVASLENLMTFPFITSAVDDGTLSLHGLWTDIGEGGLQCFDPAADRFVPV